MKTYTCPAATSGRSRIREISNGRGPGGTKEGMRRIRRIRINMMNKKIKRIRRIRKIRKRKMY